MPTWVITLETSYDPEGEALWFDRLTTNGETAPFGWA